MNLTSSELSKADPSLRKALASAAPDDKVRVVMTLDPAAPEPSTNSRPSSSHTSTSPTSQTNSRQRLIDQRRAVLAAGLGEVLESLRGLSLKVHGGTLGRVVVAEGTADKISAGLKLPAVRSATLDRELNFNRPRRHDPDKP